MTLEEILLAGSAGLLPSIEDVDPSTAEMDQGFVVISRRAAMPLSAVSWNIDRSDDQPIVDEQGAVLGTLCLVSTKPPIKISEMTRWQYTAFLLDCGDSGDIGATHQFSHDYAIIDQAELGRYLGQYMTGSALWGGFSHGLSVPGRPGWRQRVEARPSVVPPTSYHEAAFKLATQASGPREQYLKLYHTIELLFVFVTFRKIVKGGDDLVGFGKVMAGYQRGELDKLKVLIKEFCPDPHRLLQRVAELAPFLDRAEQMFQLHTKDGNPLAQEEKWDKFRALVESGGLDSNGLKRNSLAANDRARDDFVVGLVAYFIYRIRSSIAHSRIGEYLLTEADDDFVGRFGIVLIEETVVQIFSSRRLTELVAR